MATNRRFLLLLPILALLAASADARPCKTIFISSYSLSIKPLYPDRNPNPNSDDFSGFLTIVTEISQDRASGDDLDRENRVPLERPALPFGFSPRDVTSFRDRARDIISVVAALLFGVGCGALTASTMYLVWSLFSAREEEEFDDAAYEDAKSDVFTPKKFGYVKIPAAGSIPEPVKPAVADHVGA